MSMLPSQTCRYLNTIPQNCATSLKITNFDSYLIFTVILLEIKVLHAWLASRCRERSDRIVVLFCPTLPWITQNSYKKCFDNCCIPCECNWQLQYSSLSIITNLKTAGYCLGKCGKKLLWLRSDVGASLMWWKWSNRTKGRIESFCQPQNWIAISLKKAWFTHKKAYNKVKK